MANAQNNARPVVNALSVTPTTLIPWTVIVQVLQKNVIRLSKDGKRFQGYVLTAMEGIMIGVVCFEQHISAVRRLLQPYQRYYFSNAFVKDARVEYKVGDYPYGWTVSSRTPIELIHDVVPHNVPSEFYFTKFSEHHRWMDHDDAIAIRGLLIHSYAVGDPAQASTARGYIAVEEAGTKEFFRNQAFGFKYIFKTGLILFRCICRRGWDKGILHTNNQKCLERNTWCPY